MFLVVVILLILTGLVATLVLLYSSSYFRLRARMYERLPTTPIAELEGGRAKVVGTVVEPPKSMTSPITGKRCVYFRLTIQKKQQKDENLFVSSHKGIRLEASTELVLEDARAIRFMVEDGTGKVEVELAKADVEIVAEERIQEGALKDCKDPFRDRLTKLYTPKEFQFSRLERYEEITIQPGDQVIVIGRVRKSDNGTPLMTSGGSILTISDELDEERIVRCLNHSKQSAIGSGIVALVTVLVGAIGLVLYFTDGNRPSNNRPIVSDPRGTPKGGDPLSQAIAELNGTDAGAHIVAILKILQMPPVPNRAKEVGDTLERIVRNTEVAHERETAIAAMTRWQTPNALDVMIPLFDKTTSVTGGDYLINAIGQFREERAADALVRNYLVNPNRIRMVLTSMGKVAEPAVQKLLTHASVFHRTDACHILQNWGTRASVPALEAATLDSNPNVAAAARNALQMVRNR